MPHQSTMIMSGSLSKKKRFSYDNYAVTRAIYYLCLVIAIFGFALWLGLERKPGYKGAVEVLVLVGTFLGALCSNAVFKTSDIIISEDEISWSLFSKIWRSISWNEIQSISLQNFYDFQTGLNTKTNKVRYVIYRKGGQKYYYLKGGPITFTDTIQEIGEIRDTLNPYINRYGITVIDERNGTVIRQI